MKSLIRKVADLVSISRNMGEFSTVFYAKSRFRSVDTKSALGRVAKNRPRLTDFDRPQTLDWLSQRFFESSRKFWSNIEDLNFKKPNRYLPKNQIYTKSIISFTSKKDVAQQNYILICQHMPKITDL